MASLLCEHWELFSEAWQTSGMMRNGQVFALPMPAHLTADSEFSSQQQGLPTPKARDAQAEGYEAGLRRATPQVGTIVKGLVDGDPRVIDLMPTPNTMEHREIKTPEQIAALKEKSPGGYRNLREEVIHHLPTPKALDGIKGNLKTSQERIDAGHFVDLTNVAVDLALIGTPRATASESSSNQVANGATKGRIEDQVLLTNWGKFEPAIRRWEATLGRTAPAPTLPDGKDGAHRLSPWFTEWMMGLPEGWICDPEIGLTRNEQLKACGNGVVPQQAELALRMLLDGVDLTKSGGGQVNLPTPTVSDTFTDNLASTQQKEGSMHSVTLPQAVKWLGNNSVLE